MTNSNRIQDSHFLKNKINFSSSSSSVSSMSTSSSSSSSSSPAMTRPIQLRNIANTPVIRAEGGSITRTQLLDNLMPLSRAPWGQTSTLLDYSSVGSAPSSRSSLDRVPRRD